MNKKYQVIYADPPWAYRNKKTGGSMKSGSAAKYKTMTSEEVCAMGLRIKKIANPNSVLFLWVTTPLLPECLPVLKAWGYKYKTAIYWRKIMSLGMGFWFRGQIEICLLGVKGKIKAFRLQIPNFIQSKALKHSEKPREMRDIIEKINLKPRIELFARQKTKEWDVWGAEVESDITL